MYCFHNNTIMPLKDFSRSKRHSRKRKHAFFVQTDFFKGHDARLIFLRNYLLSGFFPLISHIEALEKVNFMPYQQIQPSFFKVKGLLRFHRVYSLHLSR